MKITRTMTIDTNEIQIGDRIEVGRYTATCQALPGEGLALFLLDQYLDKAMQMNRKNTNVGGYAASDLRKELNTGKILDVFAPLDLVPFENGDLLRLPFYGISIHLPLAGQDGRGALSAAQGDDEHGHKRRHAEPELAAREFTDPVDFLHGLFLLNFRAEADDLPLT